MLTVYGISNCGSCKKALAWMSEHSIAHQFHDFRKNGCDEKLIKTFLGKFDADELVNRRGTTWRNLSAEEQAKASSAKVAELLLQHPTLMKRPIVLGNNIKIIGFDTASFAAKLSS